tara:strand:- start:195 stop:359 length:165 start_codon:yes stop_codon:yes gene_type:complete
MREALKILDEIEEQVNSCCAITMYPEDVVELISKLREMLYQIEITNEANNTNLD